MTLRAIAISFVIWFCGSCGALNATEYVKKIYLDSGNPGTALTQGEYVVKKTKVGCPKMQTSCKLALMAMDEVCNAGQYYWQIIVKVDGNPVGAGDWVTPPSSHCGGVTWIGNAAVGPGDHKIALITNTTAPSGDAQGQWAVNYTVIVP